MILHTHAPEAHAHARVSPCADEWPLAHPVLELTFPSSSRPTLDCRNRPVGLNRFPQLRNEKLTAAP